MSQRRPSRTYALVVGIEKYDAGPEWNTLDGPANDACLFVEWLRQRGVPAENIFLFLSRLEKNSGVVPPQGVVDRPATQSNIYDTIDQLSLVEQGDLLYVFWGGHGVADRGTIRRLFCADASQKNKRNLNLDSLIHGLRTPYFNSMRQQIFIIDACAQRVDPLTRGEQFPDRTFPERGGLLDRHQTAMFATRLGGFAKNLTERKTGLFSSVVLDALHRTPDTVWPPDMSVVFEEAQKLTQEPVWLRYGDPAGNSQTYPLAPHPRPHVRQLVPQINYQLSDPELDQLSELLVQCPSLSDRSSRHNVVDELSGVIGRRRVRLSENLRADIQSIARACNLTYGGLTRLLSILWRIEGNDDLLVTIAQSFEGLAHQKLVTLCEQTKWSYDVLLQAYQATVDFLLPRWFQRDQPTSSIFAQIVEQLADEPFIILSRLPKLVEFVERLALGVSDGALQHALKRWVDDAAQAAGMTEKAVAHIRAALTRSDDTDQAYKVYLLIKIAPSLTLEPDHFSVQAWRFDDGPPVPVTIDDEDYYSDVPREELPAVCDAFHLKVADSISEHDDLTVEIFLPQQLLTESVEQWSFKQGKRKMPVGMKYPLVVRSWDRAYEPDYRDTWPIWRRKWHHGQPFLEQPRPDLVVWLSTREQQSEAALLTALEQGDALCCALTTILADIAPTNVGMVLETALSLGVPILLWPRQFGGTADDIRRHFEPHVARPLVQLPAVLKTMRKASDSDVQVMLLWDDPNRLPPDAPSNRRPAPNLAGPH